MLRVILWMVFGIICGAVIGSKTIYDSFTMEFFFFAIGGGFIGLILGLYLKKIAARKMN
ncbi:hypothetical protein [Bdellovibrio bacteriovorus]|uniref:hypothetical protein n=1 Tax=Bdellovibrio bacteriovorus TaxID=959 RepID=UPI003AA7E6EA